MSSRSLAAARARRSGDQPAPVSGNRPVTSIGSQAAFAQQMPHGMGYNMPPPPNNVRTARSMQPQQNQQFQQQMNQQQPPQQDGLPFSKLSISDAIGLITLRLGRVEQWIIDTDQENGEGQKSSSNFSIPDNHKIIDNSVLTTIINRLDAIEKNGISNSSYQPEEINKLTEDIKKLTEQFTRMGDDVTKHTLELAKHNEQIFRFNRDLTETKDILKSFMIKYDMFAQEISQNFSDYEIALGDLEKRLPITENEVSNIEENVSNEQETSLNDIDTDSNAILSFDLKNIIKQELENS
jgi:hypothetical protein